MAENNIFSRIKNGWNAFRNKNPTDISNYSNRRYITYSSNPNRLRSKRGNTKSIVNAFFNRIAVDVSNINIRHIQLDDNDRYLNDMDSELNKCLSIEANVDQTGREFIKNVVYNMIEDGSSAIIATDTTEDPNLTENYDVLSFRAGSIVEWKPLSVVCEVYNENTGDNERIELMKKNVGIVQNPFYSVMNEPNSVLKRLVRKLNLLDFIDEEIGSNKLNMVIQLPYSLRGESKKKQAEERKNDLEDQLSESKFGIGYIDNTERIIQLNRSVDNNLLDQIKYLTDELYSQLGFSKSILDGTADEQTRVNYMSQIIEPYLIAIVEEIKRKFLSREAINNKESIDYFMNILKLVPVSKIADIADKLTRNEILSSNEIRQILGYVPSQDPRADRLENKNINQRADLDNNDIINEEVVDDLY